MSLDRTAGFDMLVQISETELNNQIATAFLAGGTFPSAISVPVDTNGVTGSADLNFNTPIADLDRPRPRMGLTIPFSESQLRITSPVPLTIAPLGGVITVVDNIDMITQGNDQLAAMDFNASAPDVSVVFDTESVEILEPLLTAAGLSIEQAQNIMAGVVLTQLQTSIGRIDLTPPIPVVDDNDATTVFDMDVTTVNDSSALDRDCISFGVRMANDTGGNINQITSSMIPAGQQSLVMMSNFWLLARVMRPLIATSLDRPVEDFDTPLRLNRSIPAPGGEGTLTNLEARVVENQIYVTGRATDSGSGWSAESNFSFYIDIGLDDGAITVTASTPVVDTDVDMAWWVWLLSLGLGGLFGGIVGAIVSAVVLAIVEAVAEGVASGVISDGVSGSLGDLPSLPLGPIGGGLTLTSVVLDDLELRSTIMRSVSIPIKDQGSHIASYGFAVDLDNGVISADIRSVSDLIWNPQSGLSTNGPSGLTITGTPFGALSALQISRLALSSNQIPLGLIPSTSSLSSAFFGHDEVVFGVRTTEGRLAKVRASQSSGLLYLDWVTFDNPIPSLDISSRWSVLERGEVNEYITPNCSYCNSSPVRRCGIFEAWPRLAAFPIDYQWCICGKVLEEGSGEVSTSHGALAYRLTGRHLYIETEMAQAVDCELCVSAIDANGLELYSCIKINQSGIEKNCHQCDPNQPVIAVEMILMKPELNSWRPLIATEMTHVSENVNQKSIE